MKLEQKTQEAENFVIEHCGECNKELRIPRAVYDEVKSSKAGDDCRRTHMTAFI